MTQPTQAGLAAGTDLGDRYTIEEPIGRGGMASVYRARDRRLDRRVAIKLLEVSDAGANDQAVEWREDRLTAALNHPHIVSVYDSGVSHDGYPYLVLELIEGESLSRLAPLPLAEALRLAEQLAGALAYAHERGIVHCDLTPQNVLLDAHGQAKLTDFGVARRAAEPVGDVVYGSAPYLAPERLRGAPTTPPIDVYALGAVLYYLLTDQPPYQARSAAELVAQTEAGPPALAAAGVTAPAAVEALVARALAPAPADRYPSAAALGAALAETRRTLASRTPPRELLQRRLAPLGHWLANRRTTAAPASARRGSRVRAPLAIALIVALVLGALGITSLAHRHNQDVGVTLASAAIEATTTPPAGTTGSAPPAGSRVTSGVVAPPPAVPRGPIRAAATISDAKPKRSTTMTVTGTLLQGDTPLAGVPMRTIWHFRSGDSSCNTGTTGADGRASCTLSMNGATAKHEVTVEVSFEYQGQTYRARTAFTPD